MHVFGAVSSTMFPVVEPICTSTASSMRPVKFPHQALTASVVASTLMDKDGSLPTIIVPLRPSGLLASRRSIISLAVDKPRFEITPSVKEPILIPPDSTTAGTNGREQKSLPIRFCIALQRQFRRTLPQLTLALL